MCDAWDFLLVSDAKLFHHGSLKIRVLTRFQHPRYRERHLPIGGGSCQHTPKTDCLSLAWILPRLTNRVLDQRKTAEVALRAAPLESKLRRHLHPTVPFIADTHRLWDEGIFKENLIEIVIAGHVVNRPNIDTVGIFEIDNELGQSVMSVVGSAGCTKERDQIVGHMRT